MPLNERQSYRLLEIAPGAAVWLTLAAAVLLSWVKPLAAIIFILLFDLYWLVRVVYVLVYVVIAWRRFRRAMAVNWRAKLESDEGWSQVWHLVIIPTAKEGPDVLATTFESLARVDYPLNRLIVVLATERRSAAITRSYQPFLQAKYGQTFKALIITEHPDDLPGEIAGKGANSAWAGQQVKRYIDQEKIPYDDIIVSTFDADSIAHPQYFAYLTDAWLNHPDRWHTSFQPIPVFHNNIWAAMAPMRVVAYSTTFWMLGETMRPHRLLTFSSHSMSWRALVDIGFWQTDVVSEDSRVFLQCFMHYDGRYSVTPMYIPISMDTVQAPRWWQSWINQYKQIRRWAYGAENFPYIVWNFMRNPKISWTQKLKYSWYQFEGGWSWATAPLLILLLGWLPFNLNRAALGDSVMAHSAPGIIQVLLSLALVGLAVSALLSTTLLPPRPSRTKSYVWAVMVLQWLFLPISMTVFGSLPAIEAQTRLMLGKYLGFWVTEKKRLKS